MAAFYIHALYILEMQAFQWASITISLWVPQSNKDVSIRIELMKETSVLLQIGYQEKKSLEW